MSTILLNRAVYDLAGVVKLVVDKVTPADRLQALALLKNIAQYLHACEVPSSAVYEEPLVTVNNLIHAIDEIHTAKQTIGQFHSGSRSLISKTAAVKRASPNYESDDNDKNDFDGNSDIGEGEQQDVKETVIDEFRNNYKNRLASHLGEINYDCKDCDKTFISSCTLTDHRNKFHQTATTYPCTKCKEKFPDKKSLMAHIQAIHDNVVYKCTECEVETRHSDILKSHIETSHPEVAWTRPLDYRQPTAASFSSQLERENGFSWHCVVCKIDLKNSNSKQRHLVSTTHMGKVAKASGTQRVVYECSECNKRFSSLRYLTAHVDRIHNEDAKRYECDVCNKQFVTLSGMQSHKLLHSGVPSFNCTECEMSFFRKSVLIDHLACVHAISNIDYPCPKCDQVFTDRKRRVKHIQRAHSQFVFRCPHCEFKDRNGLKLRKHFKSCHKTEVWTKVADYRFKDDDINTLDTTIDTTADTTIDTTADTTIDTTADTTIDTTADTTIDTAAGKTIDTTADGIDAEDDRTVQPPATPQAEHKDKGDNLTPKKAEDPLPKKPRLVGIKTYSSKKKQVASDSVDEASNSVVSVEAAQQNK